MKIEMITREMEREMENYIMIISSKDSDQSSLIEGKDILIQLESNIIDFMKDKNPGEWINIPSDYISDHINALNFDYRIMKKYKVDRKEYKMMYEMDGMNFYNTREKLMKHGFKLKDCFYDDNGNVTSCILEKNDNIVNMEINGLQPHPTMDDIWMVFDQNLFHIMGKIFPHLWMGHLDDADPYKPWTWFRYSDLYNVE